MFSTYLVPDNGTGSSITFGGVDGSKFSTQMNYAPVPFQGPDWTLNSTGISVNGASTSFLSQPIPLLFDTGTPNIVFNKSITEVGQAFYLRALGRLTEF
jgi:hypothetical protein